MTVASLDAFYNGGFDPASSKTDFTSYTQSFPRANEQPFAMYRMGVYAQDQWKVQNNLSLTFALRVDHPSNPICRHLCFASLSQPFFTANNTINTPYNQAIQINNEQALMGLQNLEWQPRIGFAWQPRGSNRPTVVRGGIGIFNDNFPMSLVSNFASNPPNLPSFTIASPTFGYISPAQTTGRFRYCGCSCGQPGVPVELPVRCHAGSTAYDHAGVHNSQPVHRRQQTPHAPVPEVEFGITARFMAECRSHDQLSG